jgi:hypothetical protein
MGTGDFSMDKAPNATSTLPGSHANGKGTRYCNGVLGESG